MNTTMNINNNILDKIEEAAQARGLSCSALIVTLLKKVMDDDGNPVRMGRLVEYQKKGTPVCWHRFHVKFRADDYEYFLDLRKLLKMSLSLILAYAVKKFLWEDINADITDNYQFKNYVILMDYSEGIVYWKLFWGFPPNIGEHMR